MSNVIQLLPTEIANELATLRRLRDNMVERRLVVVTPDGADATVTEAANLDTVIRQLESALGPLFGKRQAGG